MIEGSEEQAFLISGEISYKDPFLTAGDAACFISDLRVSSWIRLSYKHTPLGRKTTKLHEISRRESKQHHKHTEPLPCYSLLRVTMVRFSVLFWVRNKGLHLLLHWMMLIFFFS